MGNSILNEQYNRVVKYRRGIAKSTTFKSYLTSLAQSPALEKLREIRSEISARELSKLSEKFGADTLEMHVARRVLQRDVALSFDSEYFVKTVSKSEYCKAPVSVAIPYQWQCNFLERGFVLKRTSCSVKYRFRNILYVFRSFVRVFILVVSLKRFQESEYFKNEEWLLSDASVLVGFSGKPIANLNSQKSLYNFESWLNKFQIDLQLETDNLRVYCEAGQQKLCEHCSSFSWTFMNRLKLLVKTHLKMFLLVHKVGWRIFLIDISEMLLHFKISIIANSCDHLQKKIVIFSNPHKNYQPFWVTSLREVGTRVVLMFYSNDSEPNFLSGNQVPLDFRGIANWDEFWLFDEEMESRLFERFNFVDSKKYFIGAPWISDLPIELVKEDRKIFTFFSLESPLNDFSLTTTQSYGYSDINCLIDTISSLIEFCTHEDFVLWHKPKRSLTTTRFPEYDRFLKRIAADYPNHYFEFPPEISTFRLILSSDFVLSSPFTSTGREAQLAHCPSAYYSSNLQYFGSTPSYLNVPLISNSKELLDWLKLTGIL